MSAVHRLLERLDGVRPSGDGRWRARCPSHGSKGPTLSIADCDGRVLVHCFAGCETADVMSSIGLSLRDLFDVPLGDSIARVGSPCRPSDVIDLALRETVVLSVIASDLLERRAINEKDWRSLAAAARRLRHLAESVKA